MIIRGNNGQGFTLVELLVAISIMTLVTSVVLMRHQSFNRSILLRNQAYDVALTIRQAQLMAVNYTGDQTSKNQTYGVRVDKTTNQYFVFYDVNNNKIYDSGDTVIGMVKTLDRRFNFYWIKAATADDINSVDITFTRPLLDANFVVHPSGGGSVARPGPLKMLIEISGSGGAAGKTKMVEVISSGSISVIDEK